MLWAIVPGLIVSGLHSSMLAVPQEAHATVTRWVHANARAFALQGVFGMLAIVPAIGVGLAMMVRPRPLARRVSEG